MVKYRNTDGEESSAPTVIPFIIHPPFYLTWWFLAIAFGLVAWLVYLLHRIRVNKLLTMEKVRVHIARDLHDDMGSTLSSINILSLMSTKAIDKEPAKSKEYLSRISAYSQRMMESMDDIVWSINPLNDGMEKIVARMREVAASNLEPKEVEYRFYIDETVSHLKLDMGKRRDLFLIYKEAINNLAKYADCSKAIIHITAKNKRILMHIEDNGCGFDETLLNDGNGLINMRKRAEDLNGRLTIKSRPGLGTELTLNIPVKN
jgi:signal transduction histidine kinase